MTTDTRTRCRRCDGFGFTGLRRCTECNGVGFPTADERARARRLQHDLAEALADERRLDRWAS